MKTLSVHELKVKQERGDKFALVNTLSPADFPKTQLPYAVNVPLEHDNFETEVERIAGGKQKPVVVYCASEQCDSSTKAAERLERAGFTNVAEFAGGAKAWQEAGEPMPGSKA